MKGPLKLIVPLAAALGVAACSAGGSSNVPSVSGIAGLSAAHVPQWALSHSAVPACAGSRVGQAQCDVLISTIQGGVHGDTYAGWNAPDLEKAV